MMQAGYWVDLATVKLDEDDSSWIQMMTVGKFNHPRWGLIDLNPERFEQFAKNFDAKVRGQDLDIDYDHKERDGKAAGWLQQVVNRGAEGLWGLVKWTKTAAEAIRNREYRYFSPEFADEWEHPESGEKHKDVLFGGAITNRPFLKDILPINMTEVFGHTDPPPTGGRTLEEFMKNLAEALGLEAEKPSEVEVIGAIVKLVEKAKTPPPPPTPEPAKESEEDPNLVKLAEEHPVIAKMLEDREKDRKRIAEVEKTNHLTEVKLQVRALSELGKQSGRVFGKSVSDKLEAILIEVPAASGEKVSKLFKELMAGGFVDIGEHGSRSTEPLVQGDGLKKFKEAVADLEKTQELSFADAAAVVARDNPELYRAYMDDMYSEEVSA